MELDKTGLQDRTFEVSSITNQRSYSFLCNRNTHVIRVSANAVEYFGLPGEYMLEASDMWNNHVHPDDCDSFRRSCTALWSGKRDWADLEFRAKNKAGEYVLCTGRIILLHGENGEPDLFTGTIVNHGIHDNIDPITNLHTGQDFVLKLRKLLEEDRPFTVLKISINVFNHINILYGYEYGDEVLAKFGEALRRVAFRRGHVYRLDGAKFAMILYGLNGEEEVLAVYERIQDIAKHRLEIKDIMTPITICGSAMMIHHYTGNDITIKSSLSYALNQSKHKNHGELVFFRKDREQNAGELDLLSAIHRSILEGCKGFYLRYQPLVDARTEKIVGAEALIRWCAKPYGDVAPGRFIPWLEMDPAFYELGNWVIRTALRDIKKIKEMYPDFILNVNIAASQLERQEFRAEVIRMVREAEFPPQDFFMELTERCRDLNYDFLRGEMDFFHRYGIKISVDDFGTGSSSLMLLKELPIDELKIDMSFIRDIESNKVDQTLVKYIVLAARDMNLKTCLEGVETEGISKYLKQHDPTYYQGYFYSMPVRVEDFSNLMENQRRIEKT